VLEDLLKDDDDKNNTLGMIAEGPVEESPCTIPTRTKAPAPVVQPRLNMLHKAQKLNFMLGSKPASAVKPGNPPQSTTITQ